MPSRPLSVRQLTAMIIAVTVVILLAVWAAAPTSTQGQPEPDSLKGCRDRIVSFTFQESAFEGFPEIVVAENVSGTGIVERHTRLHRSEAMKQYYIGWQDAILEYALDGNNSLPQGVLSKQSHLSPMGDELIRAEFEMYHLGYYECRSCLKSCLSQSSERHVRMMCIVAYSPLISRDRSDMIESLVMDDPELIAEASRVASP